MVALGASLAAFDLPPTREWLHPADFGPIVQGTASQVTDQQAETNRSAFQAAIDAGVARGLPVLVPSGNWCTPNLRPRGGTAMSGPTASAYVLRASLHGKSGAPALLLDTTTGPFYNLHFQFIRFVGNNGPAMQKTGPEQAPTYCWWEDCQFESATHSAILGEGPVSEWRISRGKITGGPTAAGFEWNQDLPWIGTVDSMRFENIQFAGFDGVRITTKQCNGVQFFGCFANNLPGSFAVLRGYGTYLFDYCYASEWMCNGPLDGGGYFVFTTATGTAGQNVVTIPAAEDNLRVGNQFTIRGAGTGGDWFFSTITAINGTSITLANNLVTSVTGQFCTNAQRDIISTGAAPNAGGTPTLTFTDSDFGGGFGSGARFGCYGGSPTITGGTVRRLYDPTGVANYTRSSYAWRPPALKGQSVGVSDGSGESWQQTNSGPGTDAIVALQPGGPNRTAPWGEWGVYKAAAAGGGRVAGISADGDLDAKGSLKAGSVTSLPTASATHRGRILRVEGGTGVADALYVCRKDAAGTYSWVQLA